MTTIYLKPDSGELPVRDENDVYETESTLVREALTRLPFSGIGLALDIGSGSGVWGKTLKSMYHTVNVRGIEIRQLPVPEEYETIYWDDFRNVKLQQEYDVIMGNPPYKYAEEIVRYGWALLKPGGYMVMLLRLAFQSGVDRYHKLWQEIYPYHTAVCSRRPSFYGGGTNGTDYAIYYWKKNDQGGCYGTPGNWSTSLLIHERV